MGLNKPSTGILHKCWMIYLLVEENILVEMMAYLNYKFHELSSYDIIDWIEVEWGRMELSSAKPGYGEKIFRCCGIIRLYGELVATHLF